MTQKCKKMKTYYFWFILIMSLWGLYLLGEKAQGDETGLFALAGCVHIAGIYLWLKFQ